MNKNARGFLIPDVPHNVLEDVAVEKVNSGKLSYAAYLAEYKKGLKKTEFQRFLERIKSIKTISNLRKWRKENGIESIMD